MDVNQELIKEREAITELLELYRDLPGLWDSSHELYTNRDARQVAYETLLECYHKFDENASLVDLKKKLENMRAAYNREKRKVEISMIDESLPGIHVPILWYYHQLSFLDGDSDTFTVKVEQCDDSDNRSDEPESKRRRTITKTQMGLIDSAQSLLKSTDVGGEESSAVAFAKSVSSQLEELPKKQRCLAEKLIGEVIFYAKMDQLNIGTVVYLNGATATNGIKKE